MSNDIEEIKAKLNIVDVLGEYIKLDKAGANWRALCPFHNEKSPSFMVSEEKQFWHCFGCQKSGDIFGFVMEMEGLEFREALKVLAEKAGVKLQNYSPQKEEEKNRALEILELAVKFYEVQLWKGEGKEKILNYLRERGLKDETIKEFRLGYAPKGWRNILEFLIKRGYKIEEINKTGLLVQKSGPSPVASTRHPLSKGEEEINPNYKLQITNYYDRFRDRIIFPIADFSGRVLGYSARVAPGGDESQAKYVNTPETESYHKSRVLYGLDKAKAEIKKQGSVLLVEGNMDVIASHQVGIKNVVAVSGTALTEDQINIIKRYTKNIQMFFDMDSAGENATKKSVKLCLANGLAVKIVSLLQGKDAADMAKENPKELEKNVVEALPAMEYFFQKTFKKFDKNNLEGKKKITEELLETVAILENEVEKNYWIKKIGEDLDISEKALTDELKKISLKDKSKLISNTLDNLKTQEPIAKKEMLLQELMGLMLVYPTIWKEASKRIREENFNFKNELFDLMLENGEKTNFDFASFINEIGDKIEINQKAQNIFSQKKYRLDLNNNVEEINLPDPMDEFENYFREIKKESKKEELDRISNDLKIAEKSGDKEAKIFLCQESGRITKELHELEEKK